MAMRHRNDPEHEDIQEQPKEYGLAEVSRLLRKSRSFAYKAKKKFLAGKPGGLPAHLNELGEWCVSAEDFLKFKAEVEREEAHKPAGLLEAQELKRLRSELGGIESSLKQTPEEMAKKLMRGQQSKFERLADPDGTLRHSNPREFHRRVEGHKRAHMLRMQIASVKKRSARREAKEADEEKPEDPEE